jgi:restriction system protein
MLLMEEAGIEPDGRANGPRYWLDSTGKSVADTAAEFLERSEPAVGVEPGSDDRMPRSRELAFPVLEALRELGGRATIHDLDAKVRDAGTFTEAQLQMRMPDGRMRLEFHLGWARRDLKKARLIRNPAKSIWELTDSGRIVDRDRTIQLLDMAETTIERPRPGSTPQLVDGGRGTAPSPEVADRVVELEARVENQRRELEPALLNAVLNASPKQFERIIVQVMEKLEYAGRGGWTVVIGGPSDGGVDCVVVEDRLALRKLYCQAKRNALHRPVEPKEVREFLGALTLKHRSEGVFVTTSTFTKEARKIEDESPLHIRLIDGKELAQLMLEFGIGTAAHTFTLHQVDSDFFNG